MSGARPVLAWINIASRGPCTMVPIAVCRQHSAHGLVEGLNARRMRCENGPSFFGRKRNDSESRSANEADFRK